MEKNILDEIILKNEVKNYLDKGAERLCIPVMGISDTIDGLPRPEWGENGMYYQKTNGTAFYNPKDSALQVVKSQDGVLIMYNRKGLKERVDAYLCAHPINTREDVQELVCFIQDNQQLLGCLEAGMTDINRFYEKNYRDVYDTDENFCRKKLIGTPEVLERGKSFVARKRTDVLYKAVHVPQGTYFGTAKAENPKGAFIRWAEDGSVRADMIQYDEFINNYDEI